MNFSFSNTTKDTKKKRRNERAHQLKIYSIGSVLILLAIVLLLNILIDKGFGKVLTFDFSVEHSNTISDESVKFLDGLPEGTKIRIVGLFEKPDKVNGTKYQYIIPILNDYVKRSRGKVSLEFVNIQMNPGIITELDPNGAYNLQKLTGQFVVSYNGRLDVIDPINCYNIDTYYLEKFDKYVATGINTEYTFTNSMMSLVNGYVSKAYIVTGLKENGSDYLKKMLKAIGVETAELAVTSSFSIPDDCNLLILNGPNNDITENMYVVIKDYLSKGGKVIAAVDYSIENANEPFKNLNRLLNDMNINVEHCMITENDPSYQLSNQINDSLADIAQGFAEFASEKRLHISMSRPMGYSGVQDQNIVATPVLTTSSQASKSVAGTNNTVQKLEGEAGVQNAAMYSANTQTGGEIFVFGTVNFTSDVYYAEFTVSDKNADFLRSCVRSMLPGSASYNINIPVIQIDSHKLNEDKATTSASTAVMIVFMIILPLILCSMAVIIYNKRKNL